MLWHKLLLLVCFLWTTVVVWYGISMLAGVSIWAMWLVLRRRTSMTNRGRLSLHLILFN